jgi:hypothetical protein
MRRTALFLLLVSMSGMAADDDSTIIYDAAFFGQYPNAVSILDIVKRIPAGNEIIRTSEASARGFSTNEDRILIDGKRYTGKANDSKSALERISVEQVLRIEIIRGSSPDIKISSQESLINIVMRQDENSGSGTWSLDAEAVEGMDPALGGFLSYGRSSDTFQYELWAKRTEQRRLFVVDELLYDASDALLQSKMEHDKISYGSDSIGASISWQPGARQRVQLNAGHSDIDFVTRATGTLIDPDQTDIGQSERYATEGQTESEVGGDYEVDLSDAVTLKVLGLVTDKEWAIQAGEDFLLDSDEREDDYQFSIDQQSSEEIIRPSIKWALNDRHQLEAGIEFATNELSSNLQLFERSGGVLLEVPVSGADTTISESRREGYLLHTFNPNPRLTLESTLATERSTIKQTGDSERRRSFSFVKPAVDLRYDLDAKQQFQLSIRRNVLQLSFGDFAASADIDNNTFVGNTELVPEKFWAFQGSYERRFAEDAGRITITALYEDIEDHIEFIPLVDLDGNITSAVGNIGDAEYYELVIAASFRLRRFGLENVVIEPKLELTRTDVRDPFTGESRSFNGQHGVYFRTEARHDVTDMGLSYGGVLSLGDERTRYDYDQISRFKRVNFASLFVEYEIRNGIALRFEANDLSNFDRGRDRVFYADGIATGLQTSRELIEHREGQVFNLRMRGSF